MLDGILDLLAAILVLGLVVAIAFGFIVPLTNGEIMQFDAKYEDKAVLNNEVVEYDNPDVLTSSYENIQKRKYSYEELVLLLSVQDSRMNKPNAINIRNLVTGYDLHSNPLININKNKNLNALLPTNPTDKVLQTIQFYAENPTEIVEMSYSNEPNLGIIRVDEEYPLIVDEMAAFLTQSNLAGKFTDRSKWSEKQQNLGDVLQNTDKKYYITYNFAIPDDSEYIKNKTEYKNLYNNEAVYMVQIEGNWQPTTNPVDTYKIYQDYVNTIRQNIFD